MAPLWETPVELLPQPSPGHRGQLENEPVDENSLWTCLALSLSLSKKGGDAILDYKGLGLKRVTKCNELVQRFS